MTSGDLLGATLCTGMYCAPLLFQLTHMGVIQLPEAPFLDLQVDTHIAQTGLKFVM